MTRRCGSAGVVLAAALAVAPVWGAGKQELAKIRGWVDPAQFIELAGGPDAVKVEISIGAPLLKVFCAGLEDELKNVTCGLESIGAIVVALHGDAVSRASRLMTSTEEVLRGRGWERLAMVRDEESEVRVLTLGDEKTIQGLVVMVLDRDEGELVFANVAGLVDLEALQRIGAQLDLPGLEHLEHGPAGKTTEDKEEQE